MLKTARNAAKLSREEAAHRLYIGSRTLADYESGRTVAPPDVVMRMAEVYGEPAFIVREMIELEWQIGELKFFALRQGIGIEQIMPLAG